MEKPRPGRLRRWLKMLAALAAVSILLVAVLAWISTDHFRAFGVPIHWSTFVLAYHGWSEPAEALLEEADKRGVAVLTPRLGEPIEPTAAPPGATHPWWRALPPIAPRCP
jgi:hypothetical protein